jgi:hypothetical protein
MQGAPGSLTSLILGDYNPEVKQHNTFNENSQKDQIDMRTDCMYLLDYKYRMFLSSNWQDQMTGATTILK